MRIIPIISASAVLRTALVALYISVGAISPVGAQDSSPELFYRSIAQAVSSAQGDLEMDLGEGYWQQDVQGTRIRWRNSPNTLTHLTFDYRNGGLASAKLRFRPAPHLWAGTEGTSFSVAIDSVLYDQYGRVVDWWVRPDNVQGGAVVATTYPKMQQALELQTTPSETFTARPFFRFTQPRRCNPTWTGCSTGRPFVEEVRFRNHGQGPGLAVTFQPNATLYFSRSGGGRFDNFVTLRAGSSVAFDHVRYDVVSREIQGHLRDLSLEAQSGELNTANLRFIMRPGASVRFNDVRFAKDASGVFIDADLGTLAFDAGQSSRVVLTRGVPNSSHLNLDNGTRVDIRGFQLAIDDRRSTTLRIGAGSNMTMQLLSGQLGVGQRGFLVLGTGTLNASLNGTWDSAEPAPDTHIEVRLLDAGITGGVLPVNGETTVTLTGGQARSTDLRLVGANFSGVVGSFEQLSMSLADRSTFGIPNSFRVVTAPGAQLIAATPGEPLRFYEGAGHPVGTLAVILPYRHFEPARDGSVVLRDGTFRMGLTQDQQGNVAGRDGTLDGILEADADGTTLTVKMEFDQIALTRPATGAARLEARVRTELQPGLSFDYTTPWPGVQDGLSLYPMRLVAQVPGTARGTEGRLEVVNSVVSVPQITFAPAVRLDIPGGSGEHPEFENPNSADGTHGPDEFKSWQELLVYNHSLCNLHIYLKPTSYTVQSQITFAIVDGELSVQLSRFRPDRRIEWGRDGCQTSGLTTVLGALLGTVIFGPIGTVGGGLLGHQVGENIDDNVDARIAVAMHEKITGFQKRWTIRAP